MNVTLAPMLRPNRRLSLILAIVALAHLATSDRAVAYGPIIIISELEAAFGSDQPRRARFAVANVGTGTADISNYGLFKSSMTSLSNATPIFGDLTLSPGERFVGTIDNFPGISGNAGELSLYNDWENPSDITMVSYLHWGPHGIVTPTSEVTRAVNENLWLDTDATIDIFPAVDSGLSLISNGGGYDPSNWSIGPSTLGVPEPTAIGLITLSLLGLFGLGRHARLRVR